MVCLVVLIVASEVTVGKIAHHLIVGNKVGIYQQMMIAMQIVVCSLGCVLVAIMETMPGLKSKLVDDFIISS